MDASYSQTPQLSIETAHIAVAAQLDLNAAPLSEPEIPLPEMENKAQTSLDDVELAAAVALPPTQSSTPASSPRLGPVDDSKMDEVKLDEVESGYASASSEYGSTPSSIPSLPQIHLTKPHIDFLNSQLENMNPQEILRFCKVLFPNLYQSTAFGLTGLATIDMLAKIQQESPSSSPQPDLIFLDTLYHFQETHDLVNRVKERYPNVKVHTFKPYGAETTAEFESLYGEKLYETEAEMYDWSAKVEPLQRAYEELKVAAVITGRRRSQGGNRDRIPVIEMDDERGVVKINPMVNWNFDQVQAYIRENNVPYNALLDQGYKSVGDWHSTSPVGEGESERAGRWKGQQKTECGIHNKKSRYAQYLEQMEAMEKQAKEEELASASATLNAESSQQQAIEVA